MHMPPHQPDRPDEWGSSILVGGWGSPPSQPGLQREPAVLLKEYGLNLPANCPPHVVEQVVRIVSLIWQDGRIVPREQFCIDPADEGVLFGRGVWECTRTFRGVPWLWPSHIERLLRTAALLEIDVDPKRLPDSGQVTEFVRTLTAMDVVVRLNVTAGRPGKPGIVWMTAMVPELPSSSVRLQTCRSPVPKGQPYLAWKTFQYSGRLRAGKEAQKAGFDSALLLDPEDNVLETPHTNIFVRLTSGWATPPADGDLLPGTVRQHLLANAPLPIREQTIPRALLAEASEAFVTNSNVGIIPVVQIDEQMFSIGSETQQLRRWLLPDAG
jgi:branched-subunit amino acid aminotransferase/4-amino-4-deoxychorismate lyase